MPWHISKQNGKFCVVKDDDESVEKCHATQQAAKDHMAALYASEGKEIDMDETPDLVEKAQGEPEPAGVVKPTAGTVTININAGAAYVEEEYEDKAVWTTAFVNDLPDSSFLYVEAGGEKDGEGKTTPRSLRHFPYKDASGKIDLPHLRNAIARIPQANIPTDKKASLQARARKLLAGANKEDEGWFDNLVLRVKEALGMERKVEAPGFMIWKEADGTYHWMARYSNNFRDQDNPPEIIAAQSHKHFDQMVSKGEAPMPDLWLWHRPEWKWGTTTWHAYDDAGFALAAGVVDKGAEPLADHLMALDPALVRVSHGMPKNSIKRDEADDSVIVEHLTREISPLPAWAAANKLTGFIILKEATDMAIPQEKRDALKTEWNLSDELLTQLEAANAADAEEGKQAGIESKEVEPEETTQEPALSKAEGAEAEGAGVEPQPEPEPEPEPQPGISREEMQAALEAIGRAISSLSEQIKEIKGQVTEVQEQKSVEEALTLSEMFERAIGHKDARVDGRTSQAKDRPAEHKEPPAIVNSGNPLADSIVNQIVSGEFMAGLRGETPTQ